MVVLVPVPTKFVFPSPNLNNLSPRRFRTSNNLPLQTYFKQHFPLLQNFVFIRYLLRLNLESYGSSEIRCCNRPGRRSKEETHFLFQFTPRCRIEHV